MLVGIGRVLLGFAGTAAMFAFWVFIVPGAVMLVAVYILKFVPLAGRQRKR
jgi:hypothetical protein